MIQGQVDLLQPIYVKEGNRPEVLVVEYDGFIKNVTEGILRTMIRDVELWEDKYPGIVDYVEADQLTVYTATLIYSPILFLWLMSDQKLEFDIISKDLKIIEPDVLVDLQMITSFEYALYTTLQEAFVEKCYFIKTGTFYENELRYLEKAYSASISKISFYESSALPFITNPEVTSIFMNDTMTLFDTLNDTKKDNSAVKGKLFILRNNSTNLEYDEANNQFIYLYDKEIKEFNDLELYGISRMYNQSIDNNTDDATIEDSDTPDENSNQEEPLM